jgi:hypothetical protein
VVGFVRGVSESMNGRENAGMILIEEEKKIEGGENFRVLISFKITNENFIGNLTR